MSPLHSACWKGQTEAVEFLLSNGAQIAESDTSLKTALHWTVQFGHFETLLTLLKVQHARLCVLHLIQQRLSLPFCCCYTVRLFALIPFLQKDRMKVND